MTGILSLLSFRGGTGKSNIAANLAWLAARAGQRVAVIDTDLQSPGVHIVFQIDTARIVFTLSDFVAGKCSLDEAALDVTREIGIDKGAGKVFLLPSSMRLEAISRVIADGYDAGRLNEEMTRLSRTLKLDLLIVDSHPGLNRETLLTAAVSDLLLVLVRPDAQDFQGTGVIAEVARKIQVPQVRLVANKVVDGIDPVRFKAQLESAFDLEVIATLPMIPEMARLGSRGVFARLFPEHPAVRLLDDLRARTVELLMPVRSAAESGANAEDEGV